MDDIKKNNIYKLEIIDITHEGMGIAKYAAFPIFVAYALKDEVVDVKIIKVTKKYAIGKLVKIYKKAKDRVAPFCDVFKRCGGCDLQHINYKEQLNIKKQIVENNLRRIGGFTDIKVKEIIGMEYPYEYRNKVQYPILNNEVGFYAKKSHDIIVHNECKIQSDIINDIVDYLKQKLDNNIRHIVFRSGDEGVMLILVSNITSTNIDINKLIIKFPIIKTIVLNHNNTNTNVVMSKKNKILYGKGYIEDALLENTFRISPNSFYQVNKSQTEVLYKKAIQLANIDKTHTVLDLYCGIGTIALSVAKQAKKVIGIETVEEAIKDANVNKKNNKINNVQFICNKAEDEIVRLYDKEIKADVVIIDPPRKGCDRRLIDTIIKMNVNKIVYISCESSTLARDLEIFCKNYYNIKEVIAIDMFPHTKHVETVTLLERK